MSIQTTNKQAKNKQTSMFSRDLIGDWRDDSEIRSTECFLGDLFWFPVPHGRSQTFGTPLPDYQTIFADTHAGKSSKHIRYKIIIYILKASLSTCLYYEVGGRIIF